MLGGLTTHCSAVAMPCCDTVGKDALDGAAVEVHQHLRRQADFL